jgi:hypothetical protein
MNESEFAVAESYDQGWEDKKLHVIEVIQTMADEGYDKEILEEIHFRL